MFATGMSVTQSLNGWAHSTLTERTTVARAFWIDENSGHNRKVGYSMSLTSRVALDQMSPKEKIGVCAELINFPTLQPPSNIHHKNPSA